STSGLCITWTWTPPHRFGSETSLGTDSTGTGGDRISHAPPAAARPDGPGRHHARRPGAERRRQDRAAQIAPRALAPPRRQARAPAGPLAARRIRAAARPPGYELAAARPGRRVDGPGPPRRAAEAVQGGRPGRGLRRAERDRRGRPRRAAAVRALGRPAPESVDRPRHCRRAGAAGPGR